MNKDDTGTRRCEVKWSEMGAGHRGSLQWRRATKTERTFIPVGL